MESITERPTVDSFTPLSEHQEQTPAAFFGSRAVLHAYAPQAKVVVQTADLLSQPLLQNLGDSAQTTADGSRETANDNAVIENIEIWVTSENLIICSTVTGKGISLTYPSIALHALGKDASQPSDQGTASNAVFLQINLQDPEEAMPSDVDIDTLDLTLVPLSLAEPSPSNPEVDTEGVDGLENGHKPKSPVEVIFAALSACADLHPDPQSPDEDAAETMPGAGGWITSDSLGGMDIQFDENGNFIMPSGLGAGAGSIRPRDDDHDEAEEDGEDSKWQRTD